MTPQVFSAVRGPKQGELAVIKLRNEGQYTVLISANPWSGYADYPSVHVVKIHTVEFSGFFVHDENWPLTKLAETYKVHATTLGASDEAIEALSNIIKITPEEKTMAAAKATAGKASGKKTDMTKPAGKKPAVTKTAGIDENPAAEANRPGATTPPVEQVERSAGTPKKQAEAKGKAALEKTQPKTAAAKSTGTKAGAEAKTAAAPKAGDAKPSASSMFKQLILEGKLTDEQIFAKVQKEFGLSDDKRGYVKWYRNDLAKKGQNPPAAKT